MHSWSLIQFAQGELSISVDSRYLSSPAAVYVSYSHKAKLIIWLELLDLLAACIGLL